MEIYLDVLILENLVINYLILYVTAKFSKYRTSTLRLFLGAIIGALYVGIIIIEPDIKVFYTTVAKILLSFFIIAVTFFPRSIMTFIKTLVIFYISTFIFAGAALAFLFFNDQGGFVKNGIVYVFGQSKWSLMFFSLVTVGIIIKIFMEVIQSKFTRENLLIPVKITFDNRKIGFPALVDTGNSLKDPLTNNPVMVVEFNALEELLPIEIKDIFKNSKEDDLSCVTTTISTSKWFSRFRLIPFSSLGKENGMLIGFKPDFIEIGEEEEKRDVKNVIVGIYNKSLSRNEKYKALLGPELVA
ncbi:sigma-E processing peptidase SpoIIGA [Ruminiclostridium papyrosolvens DSM 2782]|uniref:Sporulation sigma-E factor-processing peptidase n=1 Tax=Ruminiclostridium papyrosolvens DSM 2782 TaxID=588581 RepID=F1THR3_9FIRM|nr:sigma-E processing peptidase SpoIIGA [Ruminiclostridium papyrosolvens]EGD46045.1 sigma-E processing peptidase SpoIIGA [Ruminiclostridium papyrosolvens DSM 2782]WES32845.1 sigma-E processing peptidase SpoIIGA [Ruminiclostridium papyrosolvens DSM 2782]